MTHLHAKPLFITLSCIDLIDPVMNEPTIVVRQQPMFAGCLLAWSSACKKLITDRNLMSSRREFGWFVLQGGLHLHVRTEQRVYSWSPSLSHPRLNKVLIPYEKQLHFSFSKRAREKYVAHPDDIYELETQYEDFTET